MAVIGRLDVYSAAGVLLGRISDFDWLSCRTQVNDPGLLQAVFPSTHRIVGLLEQHGEVEFWWKDGEAGIDWTRMFNGPFLKDDRTEYSSSPGTYDLRIPGSMIYMDWRIVAWPAETVDRCAFTGIPAETIAKTLVDYNLGPNATVANGRILDGDMTGVSIQADGATGTNLDWNCFGAFLLETLRDLAKVGAGDFDLVKTSTTTWEFRWYDGQLGTDRTASVIFSLSKDTMRKPTYIRRGISERTVAVIGGQGIDSSRVFRTRTSVTYSSSNHREVFINAPDLADNDALDDRGDVQLERRKYEEEFSFEMHEIASQRFGKHYFLGDLVTVINPFTLVSATYQVEAVTMSLQKSGARSLSVDVQAV